MTSHDTLAAAIDRATEILIAHRTGFMPKGRDWHSNSEKGIMCYGCDRTWLFADDRNAGAAAHRHVAELMADEGLLKSPVRLEETPPREISGRHESIHVTFTA